MRRARSFVWVLTTACLALAVFVFAALIVQARGGAFANAAFPLLITPYALVGGLIASRRPGNTIGWLFLGASFGILLGGSLAVSEGMILDPGWRIAAAAMAVIGASMMDVSFVLLVTFLILLFPDGRPPSPRWRPVLWMTGVAIVLLQSQGFVEPTLLSGNPNPLTGWSGAATLRSIAELANGPIFLALPVLAVAGLASRYRRAGAIERLQLRWFLLTAAAMVAALVVTAAVPAMESVGDIVGPIVFSLLPVTVAIAILRHRLFDIDLVINRTLVYVTLTVVLIAVYWASVIALSAAMSSLTGGDNLAVAASTLAVAALFQPLRRRVQLAVDRRFYRSRYDARRTLEAFSGRLRDEVDMTHLTDDLRGVVAEALEPKSVSIWLRPGGRAP